MQSDYTMDYKITTFDADRNRRIKISSVLKLQQEVGELHLECCDMPYTKLYDQNMVFIIARTRMVFYRAPELLERVKLTTWSRGTEGMLFHRCYCFTSASGEPLIDSQTGFALFDPERRRLRRPTDFDQLYDLHLPERENGCPRPEKLRIDTGELKQAGARKVTFSDTDYNGHMNNAVYADILCDYLPDGMGDRRVKEVQINYIKEALEGEELEIYTGKYSDGNLLCAKKQNATIFTAQLRFF